MSRYPTLSLLFVILLLSVPLSAHDFWLEPTTFVASDGKIVGVRLRVGQDLAGDPVPRDPSAIEQFVAADGEETLTVVGRDGADPAGLVRPGSSGLLVIGYRSRPSPVTLNAGKFTQYLKDEGLESIVAERARRGQSGADGREIFSRAAKSLVKTGAAQSGAQDRALGFRLELIAEANPYAMTAGQPLSVRLVYERKPLAGALVVAVNKFKPRAPVTARTDGQGRVSLTLVEPGMWMVKAVHMIPAPAGSNADWESVWASLTFELTPTR